MHKAPKDSVSQVGHGARLEDTDGKSKSFVLFQGYTFYHVYKIWEERQGAKRPICFLFMDKEVIYVLFVSTERDICHFLDNGGMG